MAIAGTDSDPDIVTVQAFAERFRVDAATVRYWVKKGYIDYVLIGPRKLKRVRKSDIAVPIGPIFTAIRFLIHRDGLDDEMARSIVMGMEPSDLAALLAESIAAKAKENGNGHKG